MIGYKSVIKYIAILSVSMYKGVSHTLVYCYTQCVIFVSSTICLITRNHLLCVKITFDRTNYFSSIYPLNMDVKTKRSVYILHPLLSLNTSPVSMVIIPEISRDLLTK